MLRLWLNESKGSAGDDSETAHTARRQAQQTALSEHHSSSMECIAALIANLSQCSATLSIVCLAFSSVIRSAKRRASLARWCQYLRSLTFGAKHGAFSYA